MQQCNDLVYHRIDSGKISVINWYYGKRGSAPGICPTIRECRTDRRMTKTFKAEAWWWFFFKRAHHLKLALQAEQDLFLGERKAQLV